MKNGRWGSLQTAIKGQNLSEEDQLFILTQAGINLTATRGFTAPEARVCYERVEFLCSSLDRPLLLYAALTSQWRYSLVTDTLTATMRIAQRIYSLAQEQNDAALTVGAYRALATTLYYMSDFEAARQHPQRGVQLWRSGVTPSPIEELHAPAVLCMCWEALSEWHLGEIASCHATMEEAISLAKAIKDAHALAMALLNAGLLGHFEHHPEEVERVASEVIELSTRHNFALWQYVGEALRGWARSAFGDITEGRIEHGLEDMRATGWMLCVP